MMMKPGQIYPNMPADLTPEQCGKWRRERGEEIVKKYEMGYTVPELSNYFGVTGNTIRYYLFPDRRQYVAAGRYRDGDDVPELNEIRDLVASRKLPKRSWDYVLLTDQDMETIKEVIRDCKEGNRDTISLLDIARYVGVSYNTLRTRLGLVKPPRKKKKKSAKTKKRKGGQK